MKYPRDGESRASCKREAREEPALFWRSEKTESEFSSQLHAQGTSAVPKWEEADTSNVGVSKHCSCRAVVPY